MCSGPIACLGLTEPIGRPSEMRGRPRPNAITFLSHRDTQSLDESGSVSEPLFVLRSGTLMKISGTLTLLTLVLMPISAHAESRGTDAALGAVSGALVFGPVGAVAGAVVGFTAGPAISNSWSANGRARHRARTQPRQMDTRAAPQQPSPGNTAAGQARQVSGPTIPASNPSAQAAMPANPATAQAKAPPVQGLE
jgi:hypothetical protein